MTRKRTLASAIALIAVAALVAAGAIFDAVERVIATRTVGGD